uniref:Haptoglobin-related protein n=1 Tax=Nephromyces sp. MMRI TaxID=2496275 RepID=A0A3S8V369_9APIC|nr:haptoglobin-related protein [Nephromyces sp. MMRI]
MIQENNQPMFKVLVADPIDNAGLSILKKFALIHIYTKHTEEELMMCIHDYDALIVRSSTYVSSKIIKNATNLKIIGRAGVGVDNIDVQTATQAGVYVVCSPLGNTIAAAEHTLALMLTLSRNITNANNSIREGKWERSKFIGIQLQHKILGIIGLGQVGSHVAQVAIAMQMTVLCYDPYVNKEKCNSLGCQLCTLDELLRESDYISLHVPLVEKTKHLICKKLLN